MNKYTRKIINFINKNNFKINNINLKNNLFITKILNICKQINNIILPEYKKNIKYISKLHSKNEYPQLYYFFKKYNPNIKSFKDFVSYYSLNQHNINKHNLENDIQNNKELYDMFNNIYNNNNDRSELVNIFYNKFQSIDIIQEIESNDLIHIELQIDNIRISLYYYDNNLNINDIINNIIRITLLINKITLEYNIHVSNYDIIIFLGKNKKYLFNKKQIITPMNINSGSTLISSYVSLWRIEEYEKVLIHELLHYIGIDYHMFTNKKLNDKINNIFKIDGINHINESYNECVASIINMCWKSIKFNIDINNIYKLETKFLIFQTNKIINFFGGNKGEDLFNIHITQTSSALSYIIIKMILFLNIDMILELIENVKIKLDINDNIDLYESLLINLLTKKEYITFLDYNFNISGDKTKFIGKTMRMSVL
jgi:hypothetical protein